MITYFNIMVLLMLIKSTLTHFSVKKGAMKWHYGDGFLKLPFSQYKSTLEQSIFYYLNVLCNGCFLLPQFSYCNHLPGISIISENDF